jgi:hypothetical protein
MAGSMDPDPRTKLHCFGNWPRPSSALPNTDPNMKAETEEARNCPILGSSVKGRRCRTTQARVGRYPTLSSRDSLYEKIPWLCNEHHSKEEEESCHNCSTTICCIQCHDQGKTHECDNNPAKSADEAGLKMSVHSNLTIRFCIMKSILDADAHIFAGG